MGTGSGDSGHQHGEGDGCLEIPARRQEFIKDHLEAVKQQCNEFRSCVDELYFKENFHVILQGDDIELEHICGFLYPDSEQTNKTSECTTSGRQAIIDDLDKHLEEAMELDTHDHDDQHNDTEDWPAINACLNNTGVHVHDSEGQHLRPICSKLTENNKNMICDHKVHHQLEGYLNHQLDHLQCTCKSLDKLNPPFPKKYRLAIAGSILVFIIFMVVLITCLCKRRKRKMKRRRLQNQETLSRVDYHISKGSNSIIDDYHTNPYAVPIDPIYRKAGKMSIPVRPPALPPRYTSYPTFPIDDNTQTAEYLLPNDLPVLDRSLLPYESRRLTSPDGASVEDISGKPEVLPGYDPLGPKSVQPEYTAVIHPPEDTIPNYFVLEEDNKYSKNV